MFKVTARWIGSSSGIFVGVRWLDNRSVDLSYCNFRLENLCILIRPSEGGGSKHSFHSCLVFIKLVFWWNKNQNKKDHFKEIHNTGLMKLTLPLILCLCNVNVALKLLYTLHKTMDCIRICATLIIFSHKFLNPCKTRVKEVPWYKIRNVKAWLHKTKLWYCL